MDENGITKIERFGMIDFIINLIDYSNKKKILNFFKKNLSDKEITVIDIGAHKGETINFFTKNFNVVKIFAFEPNQDLFNFLKRKIINKNVYLYNYGVGLKNEHKDLTITIDSASSTINKINTNTKYFKRKEKILAFGKNKNFFKDKQKIEVKNLSDFILDKEKKIDILKIDTEGYEFNILKGINSIDFKKIKFIYFEHHYDLMIEKGYKFYDINRLLKKNNFTQKYKIKMKFRKSFEYIYSSN